MLYVFNNIRPGRLKQISHLLLRKPYSLIFQPNIDCYLTTFCLVDKNLTFVFSIHTYSPISSQIGNINKNLAEQLQALYTSEFDVTVHHATAKLSDICHYSVEKVNVDELSTLTYYSTENMQPNKVSSVEATNLPSIKQTTRCHKGDVLVSNIRPYFKKIEYVTTECGCSADVLCFVPASKELSAFLYETLYADRFFDYMVAGSKGTKMPRGDKQQIMQYGVVMPSYEQLLTFNATATPMLALITNGMLENERLSMLRDSLLPRLMSGELDVSEIGF
jgi:type I restriction enzyme, S subunit